LPPRPRAPETQQPPAAVKRRSWLVELLLTATLPVFTVLIGVSCWLIFGPQVEARVIEQSLDDTATTHEVEVGEFRFTFSAGRSASAAADEQPQVRIVEFTLIALVNTERAGDIADVLRLEECLYQNRARVQQAVRTIVANSLPEELSDPELTAVRARVHDSLQRVLGKPLIDEVAFTDWSCFETPHTLP